MKFDFRAYGRTSYETRREVGDRANRLMMMPAGDRRERAAGGDVDAAEAEAFLQKWLGTSGQVWDRVVESSAGYGPYVAAMTRAAELGSSDAAIDLGWFGPVTDRTTWMERAARAGRPQASMWLAARAAETGEFESALRWARAPAVAGCERAIVMFGLLALEPAWRANGDADDVRVDAETFLSVAIDRSDALAPYVLVDLLTAWGRDVPEELAPLADRRWPDDRRLARRGEASWFDLLR